MEMDRPSVALAHFMDSMKIESESRSPSDYGNLVMVHTACGESICDVEDGDTLRVLFNTALGHLCPDTKGKKS